MIFRTKKVNNYTTMSNEHLQDRRLTIEAMGVMSILLSYKDNWNVSAKQIARNTKTGEHAVRSALELLEKYGYLNKKRATRENGQFAGWIYYIFESPSMNKEFNGEIEKNDTEIIDDEFENREEIKNIETEQKHNTNEIKIQKDETPVNLNHDDKKFIEDKEKEMKTIRPVARMIISVPTITEIKKYCIENNYSVDPQYFYDYYNKRDWCCGNTPMLDWEFTLDNWEKRTKKLKKSAPNQNAKQRQDGNKILILENDNEIPLSVKQWQVEMGLRKAL